MNIYVKNRIYGSENNFINFGGYGSRISRPYIDINNTNIIKTTTLIIPVKLYIGRTIFYHHTFVNEKDDFYFLLISKFYNNDSYEHII